MGAFSSFSDCWSAIGAIPPGTTISAWSVSGRAHSKFQVVTITTSRVEIELDNGKPRRIARADFQNIYDNLWVKYKSGCLQRHKLRDATPNSTYILSIFHYVEPRNVPSL